MFELYNTLTRSKEVFKPLEKGRVKVYTCGPTIYNYAHIGNLSSYLSADFLKRYLRYSGYEVMDVMNLTDVDDKTIKASGGQAEKLKELTAFFGEEFLKDIKEINILTPKIVCRATEHINEMIELVQKLLDKNYAYKSEDGSVYFKISAFKTYGQLANLKMEDLKADAGGRTKADDYEKENASDFVLWKAWTPDDGEIFWEAPFDKGRPGWHIECSAMSMKYLGETFDIHTGAIDLIFPHHQNEIAQSEAATGKKFVNYWMERAFLKVNDQKMAKRLNNFYTLKDIKDKMSNPLVFRFLVLSNHYQLPLNFTFESLQAADNAVSKIWNFVANISLLSGEDEKENISAIKKLISDNEKEFKEFLDDDLNAPRAIASLFDFMGEINKLMSEKKFGAEIKNLILTYLKKIDSVWGFIFKEETKINLEISKEEINKKIADRNKYRENKEWGKADEIRKELEEKGIILEDKEGTTRYKIVKK